MAIINVTTVFEAATITQAVASDDSMGMIHE
jgi:hypothetical protein